MSQVTVIETNIYTVDVPNDLSGNEKQEYVIEEWCQGYIDDPSSTELEFVVDEFENIINNYHYYTRLYSEEISKLTTEIMKQHKNICDIQMFPNPDRLLILTTNPKQNYVIEIKNKQQVLSDVNELLSN
jgi:hypothetical protein